MKKLLVLFIPVCSLCFLSACGGSSGSGNGSGKGNAVPSVTIVSPSSATEGAASQTLTINGTNFLSSSTVTYNGAGHAATFVSSTELTITLSASDQAVAGFFPVVVTNPPPGGGSSNAEHFEVIGPNSGPNPVPLLNQPLLPDTAAPGGAGFTLTVNGTGFVPTSVVYFNGAALATTFVSGEQLTAAVPSAEIAAAGTISVTVVTPVPGGGRSNAVFFPVATSEANVSFANAAGSPITLVPSAFAVTLGDFNGDGKIDIAVSGNNIVAILLGNGDGTFTQAPGSPIAVGSSPCFMAVGDFNGDGKLDLAVANYTRNNVTILLGNGDGTFTEAPGSPVAAGVGPFFVVVGDFNGDGKLDLAVPNDTSNNMTVLLGNGDGTFAPAPQSPVAVGVGPIWATAGDFNGDGKLDLAVANLASNNVTVLLGKGDGTFTPAPGSPLSIPGGVETLGVVAGDFNGDGKLDLAVTSAVSGSLTIFLGNGDGAFTLAPGSPIFAGFGAFYPAMGDFNGDGKLDLAVSNPETSTVTILVGNGDGTFTLSTSSFSTGNTPQSIVAGDFNGDGRLDLATANHGDNTVSILLQQ